MNLSFRLFIMFCSVFFLTLMCCDSDAPELSGGINGIVTDQLSGEPLSGVNLTLSPSGLSKVSGDDGRYEFSSLEPQQYDVQAQKVGYKYNVKSATVFAGQFTKCDISIEAKSN